MARRAHKQLTLFDLGPPDEGRGHYIMIRKGKTWFVLSGPHASFNAAAQLLKETALEFRRRAIRVCLKTVYR